MKNIRPCSALSEVRFADEFSVGRIQLTIKINSHTKRGKTGEKLKTASREYGAHSEYGLLVQCRTGNALHYPGHRVNKTVLPF